MDEIPYEAQDAARTLLRVLDLAAPSPEAGSSRDSDSWASSSDGSLPYGSGALPGSSEDDFDMPYGYPDRDHRAMEDSESDPSPPRRPAPQTSPPRTPEAQISTPPPPPAPSFLPLLSPLGLAQPPNPSPLAMEAAAHILSLREALLAERRRTARLEAEVHEERQCGMQYVVTRAQLADLQEEMAGQMTRMEHSLVNMQYGLEQVKTVVDGLGRTVGRMEWGFEEVRRGMWDGDGDGEGMTAV